MTAKKPIVKAPKKPSKKKAAKPPTIYDLCRDTNQMLESLCETMHDVLRDVDRTAVVLNKHLMAEHSGASQPPVIVKDVIRDLKSKDKIQKAWDLRCKLWAERETIFRSSVKRPCEERADAKKEADEIDKRTYDLCLDAEREFAEVIVQERGPETRITTVGTIGCKLSTGELFTKS